MYFLDVLLDVLLDVHTFNIFNILYSHLILVYRGIMFSNYPQYFIEIMF